MRSQISETSVSEARDSIIIELRDTIRELTSITVQLNPEGDTVKVTLGGKEYIRGKVEFELNVKSYQYFYARKLDDELICTIMISGLAKDEPGDYEKLFE